MESDAKQTEMNWDWENWNTSERLLVGSFVATVASLILPWRDQILYSRMGLMVIEWWIAVALLAYSAIKILGGSEISKKVAIIFSVISILFALVNIGAKIETIEADGFLFLVDTMVDLNGVGAYLFLAASASNLVGALMYQKKSV